MVSLARRAWLLQATLVGCAQTEAPPRPPDNLLTPWRQWPGGFLSPMVPGAGGLPLAGSGTYVRFSRAAAIALRGTDLLLADLPAGRLWRCDTGFNTVTGVAGAPVSPGMALALGPDLSAWLLDPMARQVLRFARDGRLLRHLNLPIGLPSPVGLALADSGITVLVADGLGARWVELRGSLAIEVRPSGPEGARVQGVDALAVTPAGVYLLDRQSAVVHLARRDGTVLATRGQGQLLQPTALAVDRQERVFVLDARDHGVVCLWPDGRAERLSSARLGVQQVGTLAVDDLMLAVADSLSGQVVVHRLGRSVVP